MLLAFAEIRFSFNNLGFQLSLKRKFVYILGIMTSFLPLKNEIEHLNAGVKHIPPHSKSCYNLADAMKGVQGLQEYSDRSFQRVGMDADIQVARRLMVPVDFDYRFQANNPATFDKSSCSLSPFDLEGIDEMSRRRCPKY